MSYVAPSVKQLVWIRARGCCERCGRPVYANPGYSYHHRRIKGMGGDSRPTTDKAGNILLLCGSGTTGCHGFVHGKGQEQARKHGWLVSREEEPAEVMVFLAWHGWSFIDDAGEVRQAA